MRNPLKNQSILTLTSSTGNKDYKIVSCVGEGASCIVYEAVYFDDFGIGRNVRIKELYPVDGCSSDRDEKGRIIWNSEENRSQKFHVFEISYQRHIQFQNMVQLSNSTSIITDELMHANDTLYFVMDCSAGKTFNKLVPASLQEILTVCRTLAVFAKKYHEQGYLLLDIKPENFLVIDETKQLIRYLDYDSVVHQDLIRTNASNLSCSPQWAAPELLQGNISRISFATDFYSIGAVAWNKVFGTDVTSRERSTGFKPDYDSSACCRNINPKAYDLLTDFFRKTLSNNPSRRYHNDDEMIEELDELIKLTDPSSVFLLSTNLEQKIPFVGRSKELQAIDDAFNQGKTTVYINGCGGIGKTELAKQYALKSNAKFHTILFGKCENGLFNLFDDANVFCFCSAVKIHDTQERIRLLKETVDEHTLMVIDNLDVLEDEYFSVLDDLHCCKIITTRTNLAGIIENSNTTQILPLSIMEKDDLNTLFYSYYHRNISENEKKFVPKIIDQVGGLSLMVPILAKQMTLESILPSQMYDRFSRTRLKGISITLIRHFKDNKLISDTAYNQASRLFEVFRLSENEKKLLYVMALLGNARVDKKTLAAFAGIFHKQPRESKYQDLKDVLNHSMKEASVSAVNKLIEKGYVEYDEVNNRIFCHSIIRELSLYEFGYSISDVPQFRRVIEKMFEDLFLKTLEDNHIYLDLYGIEHCMAEIDEVYKETCSQIVKETVCHLDINDEDNRTFLLGWIRYLLLTDNYPYYYKDIYTALEIQIKNQELSEVEQLQWDLLNCVYLNQMSNPRFFNQDRSYDEQARTVMIKMIRKALQYEPDNWIFEMIESAVYFTLKLTNHYHDFTGEDKELFSPISMMAIKTVENNPYILGSNFPEFNKYHIRQIGFTDPEEAWIDYLENIDYRLELQQKTESKKEQSEDTEKKQKRAFEREYDKPDLDKLYQTFDAMLDPSIREADKPSLTHYNSRALERENTKLVYVYFWKIGIYDGDIKPAPYDNAVCLFLNSNGRDSDYFDVSPFIQLEQSAYDYYQNGNSLMFISCLLQLLDIYSEPLEADIGGLNMHKTYLHIDSFFLYTKNDPYYTLENMRLVLKNVYTPENRNRSLTSGEALASAYINSNISEVLEHCLDLATEYHDYQLVEIVNHARAKLGDIQVDYNDEDSEGETCLDVDRLWQEVRKFHDLILTCGEEGKDELIQQIQTSQYLSPFYRNELIKACDSHVHALDMILLKDVESGMNLSADIEELEQLIKLDEKGGLDRITQMLVYVEIIFQSVLSDNYNHIKTYMQKMLDYITSHQEYHGHFDYPIFNAYGCLIDALYHAEKLSYAMLPLNDFVVSGWLMDHIDVMNYQEISMIQYYLQNACLPIFGIDNPYSYDGALDAEEKNHILQHILERIDFVTTTFIPEDYLIKDGWRLEGIYTEEKKDEYLRKCNELIEQWRDEDHSREEYLEQYQAYFDEIFPEEETDYTDSFKHLFKHNSTQKIKTVSELITSIKEKLN